MTKSPKVYVADSGLACHLLGIDSAPELERSPFLGAIFEGFVASEIVKSQVHRGRRPELYFFRDAQGLEVDFLLPGRSGSISLIECKASHTVTPAMAAPMRRLHEALQSRRPKGAEIAMSVVHRAPSTPTRTAALAPGVRALAWQDFVREL